QYAESLSPRRTQKARPDVYAKQPELRGSKLPHEMSYPTGRTLQYAVTPAQESEPAVHSSNMPAISAFFSLSRNPTDWTFASKAPRRGIDTDGRAPRILPRAALKRRHVSFQTAGHDCEPRIVTSPNLEPSSERHEHQRQHQRHVASASRFRQG